MSTSSVISDFPQPQCNGRCSNTSLKTKVHTRNFENVWTPRARRNGVCQFHVVKASSRILKILLRQNYVLNPGVSPSYATLCATQLYKHGKNQKSNERGYDKERIVLYDTKTKHKSKISPTPHSDKNTLLKTMPPRHPPAFSAPAPTCTCSLLCH